jgi:hypothetical protein
MSINIVVGSDPSDFEKLRQTINILKFVDGIDNKEDSNIDSQTIEGLIDWYNSMYSILTDPNIFVESN